MPVAGPGTTGAGERRACPDGAMEDKQHGFIEGE
jgi:hypothetical protein